jgi:signal transduction histidine kinase
VLRDGDAEVRGDATLLQVLLRNLIDNAIKHGGATQIEVAIAAQGKRAVLTVSDNGRGIAEDERERVQQRFYRGASGVPGDARAHEVSGSGLGLSIVKRIAELHGGGVDIAAASVGQGVSLRVDLPLGGAGAA